MPGTAPAQAAIFRGIRPAHDPLRVRRAQWRMRAQSAILILGSPRSGTTWLAKIFDSHPDTLYRHEPDELHLPAPDLDPTEQISLWLRHRGLRAAAKRPHFRKSWRPAPLETIRRGLAIILTGSERFPPLSVAAKRISIPDWVVPTRAGSLRGLLKLVNWDGSPATRTMPDARCIFILRHPCGQIASVIAGQTGNHLKTRFGLSEPPEAIAAAMALAGRRGIDAAGFNALPDAAKYAWSWCAFNEPAVAALRGLPNARIILYEDLCRQPEKISRDLFAFARLNWDSQTTAFLGTSTRHGGPPAYFDVFRSTDQVVDRWRQTMAPRDQQAVRNVLANSWLARYWPDLCPPP